MSDNPFAAPLVDADVNHAPPTQHGDWWIEGNHLVCEHGTVLPPVSLRSGASEDLLVVKRKLAYVPWPVYLLFFVNIIILAIVALCVQKKATLTYHLTREEKRANRRSGWMAAMLGIGGTLVIIAGGVNAVTQLMLLGTALIIVAVVIVVRLPVFTMVKIKDGWIRLKLRPEARDALQAIEVHVTLDDARRSVKRA